MPQNEKEMLEKTLEISEENNNLLKKMRRSVIYGRIFKILYWIVAIIIATGLYYVIQPYVDNVVNIYNKIMPNFQKTNNNIDSVTSQMPNNLDPNKLKSFVESLKK